MATVTETVANLRPSAPANSFPLLPLSNPAIHLLVDHEEPNGWLATQDTPGKMYSLSWVQMSLVEFDKTKPTPQNVTVAGDAELAVGQLGSGEPMDDWRRTKIPAGSILTVIRTQSLCWRQMVVPGGMHCIGRFSVSSRNNWFSKASKQVNTSFTIRSGPDSQIAELQHHRPSSRPPVPQSQRRLLL